MPAIDYNSPGCCSTAWSYQLNAVSNQTSIAFQTDIWPSSAYNPVPPQYPGDDYHYIGGQDSSDNIFIQIGYGTDSNGNEFLFSWTNQQYGPRCVSGSTSFYDYRGCRAAFSTFGVAEQTWIQFWIYQNNGTDVLYVNSTPFMERTAAGPGVLEGVYDGSEISTVADYDMTTMIGAGLGLGGFFAYFAHWTGGWINQTPITASSLQYDDGGGSDTYFGNYFARGAACGPVAYFGQYEPYGPGSGGYWAGTPNTQCLGDGTILPGS